MHTPSEIKLRTRSRVLEVAFDDGARFLLPFEYLRVHSPSAEVKGHGPGQEVLVLGKQNVGISAVEPVGQYAIKLVFDDAGNFVGYRGVGRDTSERKRAEATLRQREKELRDAACVLDISEIHLLGYKDKELAAAPPDAEPAAGNTRSLQPISVCIAPRASVGYDFTMDWIISQKLDTTGHSRVCRKRSTASRRAG